jgi:hypothetical protein
LKIELLRASPKDVLRVYVVSCGGRLLSHEKERKEGAGHVAGIREVSQESPKY